MFSPDAQRAVDALVHAGFDPVWMAARLPLDPDRVSSDSLEKEVVDWAYERFVEIEASGLFALPIDAFGDAVSPDADKEAGEGNVGPP
jgi:hypothetical protein